MRTYIVTPHKNRLDETALVRGPNACSHIYRTITAGTQSESTLQRKQSCHCSQPPIRWGLIFKGKNLLLTEQFPSLKSRPYFIKASLSWQANRKLENVALFVRMAKNNYHNVKIQHAMIQKRLPHQVTSKPM